MVLCKSITKEPIEIVLDNYLAEMRKASEQDIPKVRRRFSDWYRTLSVED